MPVQEKMETVAISERKETKEDPYIHEFEQLKTKLLELTDLEASAIDGPNKQWELLIDQSNEQYNCQVHKKIGSEFFFRIVCDFESTPEETFDIVADITQRSTWDEITESSGVVESISPTTGIHFMRSRGFWPTAPRMALVLSFLKTLDDGRYINVTRSIDSHPDFVQPEGDVRMLAHIAGLIVAPHPSGNPKLSRCIQVVDGDLGGWLPKSIVSMITTQAFPISMRRVNKMLRKIENPKSTSVLIERALGKKDQQHIPPPQKKDTVEKQKPKKAIEKQSVVKSIIGLLSNLGPILEKLQPWLVFYLFIASFLKRRRE